MTRNHIGENDFFDLHDLEALKCPMCQGHGFLDASESAQLIMESEKGKGDANEVRLPVMQSYKEDKKEINHTWEELDFALGKKLDDKSMGNVSFWEMKEENSRRRVTRKAELGSKGVPDLLCERLSTSNDLEKNLINSPKTPTNPQETLRTSIVRLKSSKWAESVEGLQDIIQLSRYHPQLLVNSMIQVYRAVSTLLKSFRSNVVRTACQAVNELFVNMANTQRPEFDELTSILLQKTADINKFIRRDANEALDSMVVHIPPVHAVRTLVQKGMTHKNPLVRTSAARLLLCTVGVVGIDSIYKGSKETRTRMLNAAAECLHDSCLEVRSYGQKLMKILMEHDDFEQVLQADVSSALLKRIDKAMTNIKCQK